MPVTKNWQPENVRMRLCQHFADWCFYLEVGRFMYHSTQQLWINLIIGYSQLTILYKNFVIKSTTLGYIQLLICFMVIIQLHSPTLYFVHFLHCIHFLFLLQSRYNYELSRIGLASVGWSLLWAKQFVYTLQMFCLGHWSKVNS